MVCQTVPILCWPQWDNYLDVIYDWELFQDVFNQWYFSPLKILPWLTDAFTMLTCELCVGTKNYTTAKR